MPERRPPLPRPRPHLPSGARPPLRRRPPSGPRSLESLLWTPADALLAVGAALVDVLGYTVVCLNENRPLAPLALCLLVLMSLPLLTLRRRPLGSASAVMLLALVLNLSVPVSSHFGAALAAALFGVARSQRGTMTVVAAVAAATLSMVGRAQPLPPSVGALTGNLLAAVVVVGAGLAYRRHQRALEARRRLLEERAVADERRRIARELHDIVAHHLTTMQLMAGGARANLAGDLEVVREALTALEASGRSALREMRQLLDVLRADDEPGEAVAAPQPGVGDLPRLVEESCRAGLPTELTVSGDRRPLPPSTELAVFRVVQESLTNARKHAGPARADIHLTYRAQRVTVEVRDSGPTRRSAGAGGRTGYGLIGMRERVALHGGTLVAGPLGGGGFGVTANLPLAAAEGEETAA